MANFFINAIIQKLLIGSRRFFLIRGKVFTLNICKQKTKLFISLYYKKISPPPPCQESRGRGGNGGGGVPPRPDYLEGEGGRGVPPRSDYSKSPKAKAREARRNPLVY